MMSKNPALLSVLSVFLASTYIACAPADPDRGVKKEARGQVAGVADGEKSVIQKLQYKGDFVMIGQGDSANAETLLLSLREITKDGKSTGQVRVFSTKEGEQVDVAQIEKYTLGIITDRIISENNPIQFQQMVRPANESIGVKARIVEYMLYIEKEKILPGAETVASASIAAGGSPAVSVARAVQTAAKLSPSREKLYFSAKEMGSEEKAQVYLLEAVTLDENRMIVEEETVTEEAAPAEEAQSEEQEQPAEEAAPAQEQPAEEQEQEQSTEEAAPAEEQEQPAEEAQSEEQEQPAEEVQSEEQEQPAEEVQSEEQEQPAEEAQSEEQEQPAEEVQAEEAENPIPEDHPSNKVD